MGGGLEAEGAVSDRDLQGSLSRWHTFGDCKVSLGAAPAMCQVSCWGLRIRKWKRQLLP